MTSCSNLDFSCVLMLSRVVENGVSGSHPSLRDFPGKKLHQRPISFGRKRVKARMNSDLHVDIILEERLGPIFSFRRYSVSHLKVGHLTC